MLEVLQDGEDYHITASELCSAPPEAVYRLLSHVRRHLDWGGRLLEGTTQRLLAMDAPEGEAGPGTEWSSIGMTAGRAWHDRSRVTRAQPPRLFEFETEGRLEDAPNVEPVEGRWVHRYEITPDVVGCRITYRLKAQLILHTPQGYHSRYPAVMYGLILPTILQRGLQSLGRLAEEEARVAPVTAEAAPEA